MLHGLNVALCLGVLFALTTSTLAQSGPSGAVSIDPFSTTGNPAVTAQNFEADLQFPSQTSSISNAAPQTAMFKPSGSGPFPALVIMPDCAGHNHSMHAFRWAKQALAKGYAVLVVDPLTPRRVGLNCAFPFGVSFPRLLKDAFDAAHWLQKQPFVNPRRIGLIGFSQGAMVGLGAAGDKYALQYGTLFKAIVSAYPVCTVNNIRHPGIDHPIDVSWVPSQVTVPILVEMGDEDTEAPAADCVPLLSALKAAGEPVEYVTYHATHEWDAQETDGFRHTVDGKNVIYLYSADVTAQSQRDAFAFLSMHLK
ncbi:MAG: dienelactone hydrolase family protein [Alphaproteobacteria bacterium]|nr:dienelactone hydrolase family protein [Alphaproteobacteria bacterium]